MEITKLNNYHINAIYTSKCDFYKVFGDEKSFKIFYSEIKKINFPVDFIKKFYLFNSNRWDLTTKENQTIKLPIKNYISSLENFFQIKECKI